MKRISIVLGFIAALFTMVSCQKDQNFIRASITPYHGDEKVHLNSTNYACWDGDEYIWINENVYQIQAISGDNEHFLIDMGTNKPAHEGDKLYAVFHSSAISNYNNDADDADDDGIIEPTIDVTLPATQTYTEDTNGNQVINAPMVAYDSITSSGGADLVFSNVCALLKVQLQPNVICYYIEVTSDNAPLNGTGTIDITSKTLTMPTTGTTDTRKVRLTVNTESNLANPKCRADGVYYIVLPPYMGSNLTVTVYDNPKTLMTFAQDAQGGHNLGASKIGVIDVNTLDAGRGLFSVDANGTLVSFAPGNLKDTNNNYFFTAEQYDAGTLYTQSNINNLSACMGGNWFILSEAQWNYLLNERPNHESLKVRATIPNGGLKGIILLPDNWANMNCPVTVTDHNNFQGVNIDNWDVVETYGAVFIPAEGMNNNYFWSTTTGTAVNFGNGNGQGGNGNICSHTGSAYIRHAHIVQQGTATTNSK
ncbi:MAG: hypothetical protein IKG81_13440 [Bacteroidales bacterium]|nr:hypothetical protein [Bacteroidales bacterium]